MFSFFRKRGRWFLNFGFSGAVYWGNNLFVSVISRNIPLGVSSQIAPEPVLFNEYPFVLSFFPLCLLSFPLLSKEFFSRIMLCEEKARGLF